MTEQTESSCPTQPTHTDTTADITVRGDLIDICGRTAHRFAVLSERSGLTIEELLNRCTAAYLPRLEAAGDPTLDEIEDAKIPLPEGALDPENLRCDEEAGDWTARGPLAEWLTAESDRLGITPGQLFEEAFQRYLTPDPRKLTGEQRREAIEQILVSEFTTRVIDSGGRMAMTMMVTMHGDQWRHLAQLAHDGGSNLDAIASETLEDALIAAREVPLKAE